MVNLFTKTDVIRLVQIWNLSVFYQELKTDIEIKNKSISKLEADMINKAAEFNSSKTVIYNSGYLKLVREE